MARRFSSPIAKLALVALSFGAALLIAELVLRLAGFDYSPLIIRERADLDEEIPTSRSDARAAHLFQDDQFTYDPRLIWRPRPRHSVFNAQGFRGPELSAEKPEGEVRVIAFGDSNTLGWGQPHGANWPDYLGRLLAETDERIVTVNAGVWGYSLLQGVERLRQALRYQPDLVLICFGSNDAHPVYLTDAEYREVLLGASLPILSGLKVTQVVMAFWDRFARPRLAGGGSEREIVHRVPLGDFETLLREVVELGADRGFESVFLTRPYIGSSRRKMSWRYWAPRYIEATLETAAVTGVAAVDLRGELRERRDLYEDESHFTRMGHRIAAKRIYDEIAPILVARGAIAAERVLAPGERFAESVEIDCGAPEAREYLVSGFSAGRQAQGRSLVRGRDSGSAIEVALSPPAGVEYVLALEARPVVEEQPVAIAASVNGRSAGEVTVVGRWAGYELVLPRGSLRDGLNRVELRYRSAAAETDRSTPPLVVFDRLALRPAAAVHGRSPAGAVASSTRGSG